MKKMLVILITIAIVLCVEFFGMFHPKISAANSSYARIITDDAELYADGSLSMARFTVPKSYYVKVIEIGSDVTRVSYMGENTNLPLVEGYIKTVNLRFGDAPSASPYPMLTLTANCDDVLFADSDKQKPRCVISNGSAARYLGEKIIGGETLVYVYALGNIGYVSKSSFIDYTLPYHPDYLAELAEQAAQSAAVSAKEAETLSSAKENVTAEEAFAPSQVIIIALLIVGVLCMIFLLFRPEQKKASQSAFFRDDDKY